MRERIPILVTIDTPTDAKENGYIFFSALIPWSISRYNNILSVAETEKLYTAVLMNDGADFFVVLMIVLTSIREPQSFSTASPNSHYMPGMDPCRSLLIMILIATTIVLAVIINFPNPAPASVNANGTLTGYVTIGPLCPVEPCTVPQDQLAAAYAARTIIISNMGGSVIAEAVPDPHSGYSITLKPGTYRLDIRYRGIDRSPDLPKTVIIRAGETVQLDISIDTGIR